MSPKEGDMRVWHIPQVPMQPFHAQVKSLEEAGAVLNALARYDMFQLEHKIKPDFCNAAGLEVFEDGEWCEWNSADYDDIDDWLSQHAND